MIIVAIFRTCDFRTILSSRSWVAVARAVEALTTVRASVQAALDVAARSSPWRVAAALAVNALTVCITVCRIAQSYNWITLNRLLLLFGRCLLQLLDNFSRRLGRGSLSRVSGIDRSCLGSGHRCSGYWICTTEMSTFLLESWKNLING